MFGVFLKAQEASPTLVLKHAHIGDEGALEVARFLAHNQVLRRLDLTGNGISSLGAKHLAGALRQNIVLESLVLRHNSIGEGGEDGLRALCAAIRESRSLRHVDLGQNVCLAGAPVAALLGDMLRSNTLLTHVEFSWMPLGPAGGQVLLDHIQQNTSLFDCQLTGCGLADDSLLRIAEVLKRNRAVKGADMQAGPYKVSVLEVTAVPRALPGDEGSPGAPLDAVAPADRGDVAVTSARTEELRERLVRWRHERLQRTCPESTDDVFALLDQLEKAQAQLDEELQAVAEVRTHMECLTQGYQDRVQRYMQDVTDKQDRLLGYEKERKDLRGVRQRLADTLQLNREAADDAREALASMQRHRDAEEARLKTDLAIAIHDRKACEERLAELTEQADRQAVENAKLRARVAQLRMDIAIT